MSGGAKGRSARRRRRDPRRRASPRGGGRRGSGGRQGSRAHADLELFVLLRRQRLDPVPALPVLSLREGRGGLRRVLAREIARHRRGRGSADGSSPAPLSRRRGRAPRVGGPVASAARGRAARVCANARGGIGPGMRMRAGNAETVPRENPNGRLARPLFFGSSSREARNFSSREPSIPVRWSVSLFPAGGDSRAFRPISASHEGTHQGKRGALHARVARVRLFFPSPGGKSISRADPRAPLGPSARHTPPERELAA